MKIYVISTQKEIGEIIFDELKNKGHEVLNLTGTNSLFSTIANDKVTPDLLVLDYLLYNHDNFDLEEALKEEKCYTPFIFYNDPCLTRNSRSRHWNGLIQEKIIVREKTNPFCIVYNRKKDEYLKVFDFLEKLVEAESLCPYIELMQKPKPFPRELKKSLFTRLKEHDNTKSINNLKNRTNLPKNLYNLLLILQENKKNPLSAEELAQIYSKKYALITENSIKVLLSNLRKKIQQDKKSDFFIQRTKEGYVLI